MLMIIIILRVIFIVYSIGNERSAPTVSDLSAQNFIKKKKFCCTYLHILCSFIIYCYGNLTFRSYLRLDESKSDRNP